MTPEDSVYLPPLEAIREERVRRVWVDDPVRFVRDTYATDPEGNPVVVDEPQQRILRAIARYNRVAVRSSHGIGKTCTAAWASPWWLATRRPALCVTLAGTWGHLEDKLWPEIRKWGRNWSLAEKFEWLAMEIRGRGADAEAFRVVSQASDKAENIEGWHSPHLLLIVDEAKAMPDEVWEAIQGARTAASLGESEVKELVLSTPPLAPVGWYARIFREGREGWHTIHVQASESHRVSGQWVEEMRRDFGEGSAVFQSKVLGEIPESGASTVLSLRSVEQAQAKEEDPTDRRKPVVTVDVAREGEDLTTVGAFKHGKHCVVAWKASTDLMEVCGMALSAVVKYGAGLLVIDDTGLGGGVTDRLREMKGQGLFPEDCRIVAEKFGGPAQRGDRFVNRKAELWWELREEFREGRLALETDEELAAHQFPRGSDLISQLVAPLYDQDSQSRIRVWDKRPEGTSNPTKQHLRALPTKSPDLAHTVVLGAWHWARLRKQPEPQADNQMGRAQQELHARIKRRVEKLARAQRRSGFQGLPGLPGMKT